jgi:hypothetical protein
MQCFMNLFGVLSDQIQVNHWDTPFHLHYWLGPGNPFSTSDC